MSYITYTSGCRLTWDLLAYSITHVEDQIEHEENIFDEFHSSGHHLGKVGVGIPLLRFLEIR